MKKRLCSLGLFSVLALAVAVSCPVTAKAAAVDDAYRAYYDFVQTELDSIDLPPTDVPSSELTNYDFYVNWINEKVCYAQLIDFDQNGIPELVFGKDLGGKGQSMVSAMIDCVYTYQDGKMVRLAGGIPVDRDFSGGDNYEYEMKVSTGSDGRKYAVYSIDASGTSRGSDYYYSVVDGKWQLVQGFHMRFSPDIYISQDVFSSTGEMHYYYVDDNSSVEMPHATWYARLQQLTSGGEKTYDLRNTVQSTPNTLATRVDPDYVAHYRTPSAWAAADVENGIAEGIVPRQLRYKFNTPITRADFCALAVSLYENSTGRTIGAKVEFSDTKDINVQKMGSLGVIQGVGDGKFAPNELLTREQAAVILNNLSSKLGTDLKAASPAFTDSSAISSWANAQVGQVQAAGIMNGIEGGKFDPQGSYTREQSIVTIMRMREISVVKGERLELTPSEESIREGTTCSVDVKFYPENTTNRTIKEWKTPDSLIATVNGGVVTGKRRGEVTITAVSPDGATGSCTITVLPAYQFNVKAERLPVTLNCLYLKDKDWEDQDYDFVPSDPIIAGTLQVTDVKPSSWTNDSLAVIEVNGTLTSLNEDFRFKFQPYLKCQVKDENGKIVYSGVVDTHGTPNSVGDMFSASIYLNNVDLEGSYTVSFRNDSGKDAGEVQAAAPEVRVEGVPLTVTDKNGTATIEEIGTELSYSTYGDCYELDISFRGTADCGHYSTPKFVWELLNSSGEVVGSGTTYASSWDIEDDGSFFIEPGYSYRGIDLENGESYTVRVRADE